MTQAQGNELTSVGAYLMNGYVYPLLAQDGYDYDNGVHLLDIESDSDWFTSLSDHDKKLISVKYKQMREKIDSEKNGNN